MLIEYFNPIQSIGSYLLGKGFDKAIKTNRKNPLPIRERFSREPIRLSISYLYQITIKSETGKTLYLLVKNSRVNMYQPPGGVYKYFDKKILQKLGARDHDAFHEKNDLRINIPKKSVGAFLKKFEDTTWRESDCKREFKEELLDTRILPKRLFDLTKMNFPILYRKTSGKRWSKPFKCYEIIFYDIIQPNLNKEQINFLQELYKTSKSKKYFFATKEDIEREGHNTHLNVDPISISEHSIRII